MFRQRYGREIIVYNDIHDRTPSIYEAHAAGFDRHRHRVMIEKNWLDRFVAKLPEDPDVLDLGCGAGEPVAEYLLKSGCSVTGADISRAMIEISSGRFPESEWIVMDMRQWTIDRSFDGVVAWDSFFHLNRDEQRAVLPVMADHVRPGGALLVTVGHEDGEVLGTVEGNDVYHASLSADEYRRILRECGFRRIEMVLEDEACDFHSVVLASELQ